MEKLVISEQKQQAINLHMEIVATGEVVAKAIVDFAKSLKKMRDSKLYVELGYENFEDYTEKMVGLKQRQAYNFIAALEGFGENKLETHSHLGITKLTSLLAIPYEIREDFIEKNDVEDLSTRELNKLIKELEEKNEQISMFQEQISTDEQQKANAKEELDRLKAEKNTLQKELEELKNKPVEVAVMESPKVDIEALRIDLENSVKADFDKKIVEIEVAKQKEIDSIKDNALKERKVLENKAQELSKKLELENNSSVAIAMIHVSNVTDNAEKLLESLKQMDRVDALKIANAFIKLMYDSTLIDFQNLIKTLGENNA